MNVTNKLAILLTLFLTLGITTVAAITEDGSSINPEFTQDSVSPSYTLQVDYSGFTGSSPAQDHIVVHMPSEIESSVDSDDITVDSPSSNVDYSLTNYDDDGEKEIYIYASDGNFPNSFNLEVDIEATSPGSEGSYVFNVNPYDDGNSGEETSLTTHVDDTAPSTPTLNSVEAKPDGKIEVEWDQANDDGTHQSGVDLYDVYRADSSNGDFTEINSNVEGTTYTDTDSDLSNGEDYFYKVRAVDGVTNKGDFSGDDSATSDSDDPTITGVAAEAGSDTVTVTFDENVYSDKSESTSFDSNDFNYNNDNGEGASSVTGATRENGDELTLTLDTEVAAGDLNSDSIQPVQGEIYDDAENTASTAAEELEDTVPPTIEKIQLNGGDVEGKELVEDDQDQSQDVTVIFDEPMNADTVSGTLEAGSESIDLSLSSGDQDDTFTGSFTIESDIEDEGAEFSISGEDQAANSLSGDYQYDSCTVDTESPQVKLTKPESGPLSGIVDLEKTLDTAEDDDAFTWEYSTNSGESWNSASLTDSGNWNTTTDFSDTENTDVDLRVTAEDDVGNTGSDTVEGLEVDNEAPTVDTDELTIEVQNSENEVANPEEDIYVEWDGSNTGADKDVTGVTADISEFGADGELTLDEGTGDQDNVWSATYNVETGDDDSELVDAEVTAEDNAENSDTETTEDISVDNNPPTVTTTNNLKDQVFSGTDVDVASYFDPSSTDGESTTYEFDDGSGWTEITNQDNWDSNDAANGEVGFRAATTDDDGNSVSVTEEATVDNKKPSIDSVTIEEVESDDFNTLNDSDSFEVTVDATDTHSSVDTVTVDLSALEIGEKDLDNVDGNTWQAEFEVPSGQEVSDFKPTVKATDEGSNEATDSPSTGIDIDSVNPQNPISTKITNPPVDQSNDETVSVDVGFGENPEAGTVYAKITDSQGDTLATGSEQADTGTTTTTVEVGFSGFDSARAGEEITALSKIVDDAGNANPDGYTAESNSVEFDNDAPTVESMSLSATPVSDSETGDGNEPTLTVNFDEAMNEDPADVTVTPDLEDDLTTNPSVENERWSDSDTFRADLQFTDDNEDTKFDVEVSGAQDEAGNSISAHSKKFSIDTDNPQRPSSVNFDSDYINIGNEGSVGYTVNLPDGVESGDVTVTAIGSGDSQKPEETKSIDSGQDKVTGDLDLSELAEGQVDLEAYITDTAGNDGDTRTNSNAAEKDTERPSDPSSISASFINEENVGDYTVDVTLQDGYEAGTLKVRLSDDSSNEVTKEVDVSADDNDDHTIAVTSIDASSLAEEDITIDAKYTDDAGNENSNGYTADKTVHKDVTPPDVESSRTVSRDEIKVKFSEDLRGNTIGQSDFTVEGFTVDDATEDAEGITVELDSAMSSGEAPEVTVLAENGVEDAYHNTIDSDITTTPTDTLAPTLSEATTVDSDGDGYIEALEFKFGEAVKVADTSAFEVSGYSGETVSDDDSDQTVRVEVDKSSSYDTGATPEVTVNAGAVEDTASTPNEFASDTTVTSDDGAAPVLRHSEINNADSDGSATKVDLTFTEFVDVSGSATAQLTNEPGELKFSSQTGETVQATYYEDTNDDNTKETAVLETGDAPEVSGFTGVEDVDHYREAGHDFSSYSSPATIDQQDLTETNVDLRMTYDTSRDEYRFTATGVSDYGSKSGVVFGFDTDNDGNYDFQVDSVSSSLQPDYYGYDDQSEDKGDYVESHDYTQDNNEKFGVFYTDSGTELQNKNTFTLTVDRSKLGSEFAVNADQDSSDFFADLDASDDAVEVTTGPSEADLVVDGDSDDLNEDYETIQNAIDNAQSGDTIVVRDGTYGGQSQQVGVTVDESVELVSENGPSSTTIHAKREAIIVDSTQDVTIKGFTVTTTQSKEDNYGEYGIRVEGKSDNFRLVHNIFEDIKDEHTVSAIGVDMKDQVTSGSNVQTDSITIRNNIIRDLDIETPTSGNDQEIRAISLNERIDNAVIESNTLRNIGSTDAKDTVGIAVFEDSGSDPREGPENFEIKLNEFSSLQASGSSSVTDIFIGGYETLGASHTVEKNRLANGLYRYSQDQEGFDSSSADALNAQGNWFGFDGIQTAGSVDHSYTNLNTADNSQSVDVDTFRRALSSGTNMVSFPINQGTLPVTDVTGDLSDENLETVWTYQNGQWKELATGSNEDDYFRGGRGYLFSMNAQETISVNVDHTYDQVISGDSPSSPVSYNLTANTWNLIGSYEEFDQGTDTALDSLETPAGNNKYSFIDGNSPSDVETGEAYWTLMTGEGGYANTQ